MRHSNQGWFQQQFSFLRRQFLQDGDLAFSNILSEEVVSKALKSVDACWLDRIYTPLITLWVFLNQVLSEDHSCRWAVARLIAHRVSRGQPACSAETGAYCQARKRLPEALFAEMARHTGRTLDADVDARWLWKGRRVYIFDGSSVAMPDTDRNQRAYPQPESQKQGLGFPLARIAAVFSLSCGAVLDLGICRYAGKGQSEQGMLRGLWDLFFPGDVMLTDRLLCSWTELVMLQQRGVDAVCHLSSHRTADFERGTRLGKGDHLIAWTKPRKPDSIDRKTYNTLPDYLMMRETHFRVEQPGFRTKSIIVATTLLDAREYSKSDLARLYRARWDAELNLRDLKQTMHMEMLRCKTPELVRKEIWTHILAYNLIRTMIAQAAIQRGLYPRSISFKGTIQTLEAFQPVIAILGQHSADFRRHLYDALLHAIATHRVANRPDRFEPRLRKRRSKHYGYLSKPRRETKLDMLMGVIEK